LLFVGFFGRFWTFLCTYYFGFILALIWLYFGAHKQAGADLHFGFILGLTNKPGLTFHFGFILGLTNKPGLTFILASIWG
jgi:hypothetical protein